GDRLGGVMAVSPGKERSMEVEPPPVGDGLEELLDQREWELRRDEEHLLLERNVPGEERTSREIHDDPCERFVQRNVRVAEAADAALVAKRLLQRLPEGEPCVLDSVMEVDVNVSMGLDRETQARMAGDRVEHVVQESDGSLDPGRDFPRRAHLQADRRLLRLPLDHAPVHAVTSLQPSSHRSFSSPPPTP